MSSGNNQSEHNGGLTSPLNDVHFQQLNQTVSTMTPTQLAWAGGYLWALSQQASGISTMAAPVSSSANQQTLTIIYASQTGNAKGVAEKLMQQANQLGLPVSLVDANDYKGKQLAKETHVVFVASTNGEGEAPDNALILHEYLQSKKAPKLDGVQYAVLGLGDSSYEFFCQTGKDFDHFLEKLGATRLLERVDCDVDYEEAADTWITDILDKVSDEISQTHPASAATVSAATSHSSDYSRQSPFSATLLTQQKITGRQSDKTVKHIEIDLEGSGIHYQPGDALGVWYENDPQLVDTILNELQLDGEQTVVVQGESLSLRQALIAKYEVTASNPQWIRHIAQYTDNTQLHQLVTDPDGLRHYAANKQIVEVLQEFPITVDAEQWLASLRQLTPRLYSIASSQSEVEEEVHLTVGLVEYDVDGQVHQGGASSFLTERLEEGDTLSVFVEHNTNFKLPDDDTTLVIMIGPGTGIAPFRSFLQERDDRQATGANWLFFGDRTFTQDFLYQVEWQKYLKSGLLTRMDVAFSRDQQEKIYVQHRLLEQAETVWQWLQDGAYLYVCGDANRMAKDVHEALVLVAQQQGELSREDAEEFVNELRKAKRYQRDVY
ncbi:assimilatory sulfite reductase (NADPH) flavoprotein subunit [Vibrio zhugei]|uniref:Sulfite reductase [NADPH] flavoprotein alpha-component n=1 Tax=Vibrio zhugei TaxID=2479546 RepID=A0ABV7CAM3_9VIBR|nr:assimilatory sulfite reductase (NADPH) flavoprotein subunit [Vibrio zhugei]